MKKRNLFMSSTIMCGLFCLAFTFDNEGIHWLWKDSEPIAIVLGIATIILLVFWFRNAKILRTESQK